MYYTGYNQMIWLKEEEKLKAFLRSPQRVLCIMGERHYELLKENPAFLISLIAKGRIEDKHIALISNR
jgi:hypothetical protein